MVGRKREGMGRGNKWRESGGTGGGGKEEVAK